MAGLAKELVEIESPSKDAAGIAAVASRLAVELEALGLRVERAQVDGGGPILRAASEAGGARPVMLLGHLDTVWPQSVARQAEDGRFLLSFPNWV